MASNHYDSFMSQNADDRQSCRLHIKRTAITDVMPAYFSKLGRVEPGSPGWFAAVSFSLDWSMEHRQSSLIAELLEDASYQMQIELHNGGCFECQIVDLDVDDFVDFGVVVIGDNSHRRFLLKQSR